MKEAAVPQVFSQITQRSKRRERVARESPAPPKSRVRGLRVAGFGNEKIFMLNGLIGRSRQPKPILRTNPDGRFGRLAASRPTPGGARRTFDALARNDRAAAVPPPCHIHLAKFRCRAWTSAGR
jgi:hypothetical protein